MIDRLRSRRDFVRVAEKGQSARSGPIRIRYAPDASTLEGVAIEHPRIGYALTRSVGSAVVRNRQRRRLREVFLALDVAGELPTGDYLVAVRPPGAAATYKELEMHVRNALQKLSLG